MGLIRQLSGTIEMTARNYTSASEDDVDDIDEDENHKSFRKQQKLIISGFTAMKASSM